MNHHHIKAAADRIADQVNVYDLEDIATCSPQELKIFAAWLRVKALEVTALRRWAAVESKLLCHQEDEISARSEA